MPYAFYISSLSTAPLAPEVIPVDEGTKFTWVEDYEMPLGVLGKFIDKLYYKRMAEKSYEKSLENLKNILEH